MKIIRILMTATLGISIILLLAMIVTATSTESMIGTSTDYIKVVPETAQKKGGVYTQTAYIRFPEDRTVECSFESKNDFQKAKVERYTVQTLTRPVYTTTCEKVYDSKNDSYHDECTTTQTGMEDYQVSVWVDITREFDGYSIDAKNSYVIPGFTIKAGKEEVIRWSYTSESTSGKWDLYCWSGGLDKYDMPFWSMRLDPFWDDTKYNMTATVNYTNIQGDIVDGEGLLYLAKFKQMSSEHELYPYLVVGYTMDDTSGNFVDIRGNNDLVMNDVNTYGENSLLGLKQTPEFDGSNDRGQSADALASIPSGTVTLWAKFDDVTTDDRTLFGFHTVSVPAGYDILYHDNDVNKLVWRMSAGTNPAKDVKTSSALNTNEWYFIAVGWNGTHSMMYINGVEVPDGPTANTYQTDAGKLDVGADYYGVSPFWHMDGNIDEVYIFNKSLSAQEVKDLYYENLVQTQLNGTDGSDLEFYSCDTEEILNFSFVNITGLANYSRYLNMTNNVTADAVRVWGITQSSNTSNVCVSLNGTTVTSTNEDVNEDLVGWAEFEPSLLSDGQLRDLSGNDATITVSGAVYWQNSSCAYGSNYSSLGCYYCDGSDDVITFDEEYTSVSLWYRNTSDVWHHYAWDGSDTFVDGSLDSTVQFPIYDDASSSYLCKNSSISFVGGVVDSVRLYNRTLSSDEIMSLYRQGSHEEQEYFNLSVVDTTEETQLNTGLFDSEYNNISLDISENEDFYVWANYTFLDNGSVINDSYGFCNFSALEIATEYRNVTGVNVSICTSGCDSDNVTSVFAGLDTDLVIHDVYRFRLCKDTPSEFGTYTIANNCSGSYSFAYNTIASCANGYTNVSVTDANCSGDATVSLWTNRGSLRPIILVDGFTVLDREHNHSEDLYFNDTLQLWVSDDLHEYNDNGTQIINVSCYYNTSGVENETDYLNISVENLPPTVTIDGIWYWLLSDYTDFTDGISAKYPLESTLNISFTASDNTLDTVIVYLNYTSNGTLIHQQTTTAREFNYTQNNFSTGANYLSGVLGYTFQVWTNDTDGSVASASKTFSAENLPPGCKWSNTTGQSFANIPLTFGNTFSDDEGETVNVSYWVNGSFNTSGLNSSGFVFNGSQGTYNLTLSCTDSFSGSFNTSIVFTYSVLCAFSVSGLCDGCRYADNEFSGVALNCTNGAVVEACYYSINDFALETVNCSGFNFSGERGKNVMNLTVEGGGVNSSLVVRFWAKDRDARITDYSVIWFSVLAVIMFFVIGGIAGSRLFMVFGCLAGVFLGFEFFAFSMVIGVMVVFGMGVMALALAIKV